MLTVRLMHTIITTSIYIAIKLPIEMWKKGIAHRWTRSWYEKKSRNKLEIRWYYQSSDYRKMFCCHFQAWLHPNYGIIFKKVSIHPYIFTQANTLLISHSIADVLIRARLAEHRREKKTNVHNTEAQNPPFQPPALKHILS